MMARLGWAVGLAAGLAMGAAGAASAAATSSGPADSGGAEDSVRVTFLVEVPASTPKEAAIWIAGDLPALGSWNGAGVRLQPIGERKYAGTVSFARGTAFEYKITRGGWDTVEKDALGGEIPNRRWTAAEDDTVGVEVGAWRDQTEDRSPRVHTLTGEIRRHPDFPSRFIKPRDVLVYLPRNYDADGTVRYPVLYFQDGQNVFDAATSFLGIEWGVDETAERLIHERRVRPFIAVAIANTPDRVADYTPAVDSTRGGGRAADYAKFMVEELKPFIDQHYRTLPGPENTGVVGSSLGGIVSLYLHIEHPKIFGLVGCLSPAAWWAGRDIVRRAAAGPGASGRVWLDIGTAEGSDAAGQAEAVADARALRDALEARGYREGKSLHYEEVAGAAHNETAWAARVGRVIEFLLGPPGAVARGR